MRALFLIPARGGSKGIPGKNIKPLNGKPLICYAIDAARRIATTEDEICVSTEDRAIAKVVEDYGLKVPFLRPAGLAQDNSGTYEVIIHALDYYRDRGMEYDVVVLLQPTSPMRTAVHIAEAMARYSPSCDMVVSVCQARSNPYYVMFHEDKCGYLQGVMDKTYMRRQDCPPVWEYNGAVYVMNVASLRAKPISQFDKRVKYVMSQSDSIDLDTPDDWDYAEYIFNKARRRDEAERRFSESFDFDSDRNADEVRWAMDQLEKSLKAKNDKANSHK